MKKKEIVRKKSMKKMEDMSKRRRRREGREMKRQREEQKIEKKQHPGGTGTGKTIRRGRGRVPRSKRGRSRST